MRAALRLAVLFALLLAGAGCSSVGDGLSPRWSQPAAERPSLASAARSAARSPGTWAPLIGAAVLTLGTLDEDLSDWASEEQPLFGRRATNRSDLLQDLAVSGALVSALVAPADSTGTRIQNLALNAGILLVDGAVTEGFKSATKRERPNGRNDLSFPSGHTSLAATGSVLLRRNLQSAPLPDGSRRVLRWGSLGLAGMTGWARLEAEKHFATDVLVGYALGNFVGELLHRWLLPADGVTLRIQPVAEGAALTVRLSLP